ncbi:hypothetical protein D3C72_2397520 [compost metagenome]
MRTSAAKSIGAGGLTSAIESEYKSATILLATNAINVGPDRPEIKPSTRPSHKVRKTHHYLYGRLPFARDIALP